MSESGEDFKLRNTIITLDPLGTTSRICRKSPLEGIHIILKGTFGDFMIARYVLSLSSTQYRICITISHQIIKLASRTVHASLESRYML